MIYGCTHMTTVVVKGLGQSCLKLESSRAHGRATTTVSLASCLVYRSSAEYCQALQEGTSSSVRTGKRVDSLDCSNELNSVSVQL